MSGKTKFNTKAVHLILCIFFAFFLWFYVSYNVFPSVTKPVTNIPVTIIGEDKLNERGLSAKLISDDKVDVKVTANRTKFKDINLKNAMATADVSSLPCAGDYTLKASVVFLSVPSSELDVNNAKAELRFTVKPYDSKEFPVTADIAKEPTDGYYIDSTTAKNGNDMTVKVSGINEDVAKVVEVKTEKVDLSDATEDTTRNLVLIPLDENGKRVESVKLSAEKIALTFKLYKQAAIPLVVKPEEEPEDVKYTIEPTSVSFYGPAAAMDANPFIHIRYRSQGSFSIPEGLTLMEGATNTYTITTQETD